jgi:hypothetical protein
MKKWLNEPLIHFLCIGALIFILYSAFQQEEKPLDQYKSVITAADISRLSDNWSARWKRPPTESELKGIVDAYIKEEVYYREALALGLDQNDTILRRRLMQKMEFLSNDLAELNQPDETVLNRYFFDNQDNYKLPARISFTHILFSTDKRGAMALADAKQVLSEIDVPRAPERGDRFMMGYDFGQETSLAVARIFGFGFSERLFSLETGSWQGPIESGYGFHLVRISEKIDAQLPEFASVIEQVRRDWMFAQRQKVNQEIYEQFKKRYEIVVENAPKQSAVANAARSNGNAL